MAQYPARSPFLYQNPATSKIEVFIIMPSTALQWRGLLLTLGFELHKPRPSMLPKLEQHLTGTCRWYQSLRLLEIYPKYFHQDHRLLSTHTRNSNTLGRQWLQIRVYPERYTCRADLEIRPALKVDEECRRPLLLKEQRLRSLYPGASVLTAAEEGYTPWVRRLSKPWKDTSRECLARVKIFPCLRGRFCIPITSIIQVTEA